MAHRKRRVPLARLAILCIFPVFAQLVTYHRACATTVMPWPWNRQVERASFVGILECEVGGQVVAKYRVIESWKGPPRGTLLTIADGRDIDQGSFVPSTFPGERFLACTFYSDRGGHSGSSYGYQGRGHPYWRRSSLTTLRFGYLSRSPLPQRYDAVRLGALGMAGTGVDRYRKAVLEYMSQSEAEREAEALRAAVREELAYRIPRDTTGRVQSASEPLKTLLDLHDVDPIVFGLISFANDHGAVGLPIVEDAFRESGGARALAGIRSPAGLSAFPGDTTRSSHLIRIIAGRLPGEVPFRWPGTQKPESLSADDLRPHRSALEGEDRSAFAKAFDSLTKHDPMAIAEAFERGSIPVLGEGQPLAARYQSASYLARQCGGDRGSVLRQMLKAQDPIVRVAGAVFLAMEDSVEGVAALRDLVSIDGFPGFWAATTLASRGEKLAMDRALEVFDWPVNDPDRGPYKSLEDRIRILLANSARSSHLNSPPSGADLYRGSPQRAKAFGKLREWWAEVRDKIEISDPWIEMYSRVRIE